MRSAPLRVAAKRTPRLSGSQLANLNSRLLLATAICLLIGAGCRQVPPAELEVWALPDLVKAAPDAAPVAVSGTFLATDNRISLWAARNETVAFQILLRQRPGQTPPKGGPQPVEVRFEPTDLAGPTVPGMAERAAIEKANFQLFGELFVPVTTFRPWYVLHTTHPATPRAFADPLVPLAPAAAVQVAPDGTTAVWVDLAVPKDAPAGRYDGRVIVRGADGAVLQEFAVQLTVWNFALPDQPALPAAGIVHLTRILQDHMGFAGGGVVPLASLRPDSEFGDRARLVLDQYFRMAHEHRLDLWLAGLRPTMNVTLAGEAAVNWDDYDSLVMPYVTGRGYADQAPPGFWPAPLDERFPDPADFGGPRGAEYGKLLTSFTANVRAHFEDRNWTPRGVILLPFEGEGLGLDAAATRMRAGWIRDRCGRLQTVGRWAPNDPAAYGVTGAAWEDLSAFVNIWAPDIRLADPAIVGEKTALWLHPTAAPFLGSGEIPAPAVDVLTWTWAAWRTRAGGLWCFGDWTLGPIGPASGRDPKQADGFFYAGPAFGAEGVLPSVRLKLLRRGQQDYQYLALLGRLGSKQLADEFASAAMYAAGTQAIGDNLLDGQLDGWSRDEQLWQRTRNLMGRALDLLAGVESGEAGDTQAILAADADLRLSLQMLLRQREAVSLRPLAARVARHAGPAGGTWRIEVPVVVYNRRTTPVAGRLQPGTLPAGMRAITRSVDVVRLAPGDSIRVALTLAADRLPGAIDGKIELPVEFAVQGGETVQAAAPLAIIRCGRFPQDKAPEIDGDLNDWPTFAANTAGRFELIGSRSVPKPYAAAALPGAGASPGESDGRTAPHGTLVTACRDGDALYLAFACRDPQVESLAEPRRNFAQYDGLVPWGQDAVVALIDPQREAGDSALPRNLLILPSGAVQATRGIPSRPRTQRDGPWLAGASVATMKLPREGAWWVEVRIPFVSLGGPPAEGAVWAVNFARIVAAAGEVSTWSGPARYPAAPGGLGNLVFADEGDD